MEIDFRTLEDIEEGMIDNMPDDEIDNWVGIDDGICKGLKSKRQDVVVVPNDENFYYNFNLEGSDVKEFIKTIKATKNYSIYEYDGIRFATDKTANSYYFANEDDMYKVSELCKKNTPEYFEESSDSDEDKFDDSEEDDLEILNEYGYDDEDSDLENWEMLDHKSVQDYDGFYTDYTLYMRVSDESPKYVCVFGDRDLYTPSYGDFDFETDNESEAYEWFDDYNGFADELDEAINTSAIVNAPANHKRLDIEGSKSKITSQQYAQYVYDLLDSDSMDMGTGIYDKTDMAFENFADLNMVDEDSWEIFYNDFDEFFDYIKGLPINDAEKVFIAIGKPFGVKSVDDINRLYDYWDSDFSDEEDMNITANNVLSSLDDSDSFVEFEDIKYTPLEVGKRIIMKNGDILYITDSDSIDTQFVWASSSRRDIDSGLGRSYPIDNIVFVER